MSVATASVGRAHLLDLVRSLANDMAGEEASPDVAQSKAEAESKNDSTVPPRTKLIRQTSEQARQVKRTLVPDGHE